ncbi:MAG: hypothetical protein AAFU51_02280 [Bacteroidota bacterium]
MVLFLLFAIPYAGRPPLYVVDILLAGLWIWLFAFSPETKKYLRPISGGLKWMVSIIAYLLFVSTVHEMLSLRIYEASIYMAGRYFLAMSLVLLVPVLIRKIGDLYKVSVIVVSAAVLTAVFAALFSLPGFSFVREFYASPSIFFPGRSALLNDTHVFTDEYVDRASALVGGANIVACWLTISVSFVFVWLRRARSSLGKIAALSLIGLICFASLLTYSRIAFVGLGFVALFSVIFGGREARILIPLLFFGAFVFITSFASGSSKFNFAYTFSKFQVSFSDPGSAVTDQARIISYTYTFPFLVDNPEYFFVGQGVGGDSAVRYAGKSKDDLVLNFNDGRVHSVFAKGTYNLGFIGTMALFMVYFRSLFVLFRSLRVALRLRWRERDVFAALLISASALLPFMIVGHVFISQPMGFAMIFLFAGLAEAVSIMTKQRVQTLLDFKSAAVYRTRL